MPTQFTEIYARAMTLLKSPVLSRMQDNDLYSFCLVMNQYLNTAITFYNPNSETHSRVSDFVASEDFVERFNGDGATSEFVISGDVAPNDDSILKVCINGEIIYKYSYDVSTQTLTLDDNIPLTTDVVELFWLNDGAFNRITPEDVTLLAMALCWAWAIQTQNNILDIDRQPNDSDFKLHAEGTTIKGKIDWVKYYEEMYKRELSKADWSPFLRNRR